MIGYICKYTPVEIFESLGFETQRIEPEVASFNQADTLMHPNICSFAKGVLEDVLTNQYEGIVLTTCCDSIRRLYDVLVEKLPDTFIYILDIPRITKDGGIKLYEQRIREMVLAFEKFSGKTFDENKLAEILKASAEKEAKKKCMLWV
jgi:benzoyl-CoA reductase/2-hydroxyglutaryl-CoA dehydratase subunit BcrC/BadD/HgdB